MLTSIVLCISDYSCLMCLYFTLHISLIPVFAWQLNYFLFTFVYFKPKAGHFVLILFLYCLLVYGILFNNLSLSSAHQLKQEDLPAIHCQLQNAAQPQTTAFLTEKEKKQSWFCLFFLNFLSVLLLYASQLVSSKFVVSL